MLRDDISLVHEGGTDVIRRVYTSADQTVGTRSDTLTDRLSDLRPVRHRSHTERTTEVLDFAGGRVRGWIRLAHGDSLAVDVPAAAVFNSSSFDLVVRSSSLASGWHTTVSSFVAPSRSIFALTARVVGVESSAGDLCWRVEADFGGTPVTFWISQSSRQLRQQVMQLGPEMQILFRQVTGVPLRIPFAASARTGPAPAPTAALDSSTRRVVVEGIVRALSLSLAPAR